MVGHTIGHNEFVVNTLEGAIFEKKRLWGRPRLQYVKEVARNTAADSYTAMKRMACSSYSWKAANRSRLKDKDDNNNNNNNNKHRDG